MKVFGPHMKRTDKEMPNFCRLAWVSDEAKLAWLPKIDKIQRAWHHTEWFSVKQGVRRVALTQIAPRLYPDKCNSLMKEGLFAIPVSIEASQNGSYSSKGKAVTTEDAFVYRVAVTNFQDAAEFKEAWDAAATFKIGSMLGYPVCCTEFFEEHWVQNQSVDTTWAMSEATGEGERRLRRETHVCNNILWRWMGVRFVPFLPCSFRCGETVRAGMKYRDLLLQSGYDEEVKWMEEILSWPLEWNALHGIVEIRTPILKVIANTDCTDEKYVVQLTGRDYPQEGAKGLTYPWNQSARIAPSFSPIRLVQLGDASGAKSQEQWSDHKWFAGDNGFKSLDSMNSAHQRIVDALIKEVSDSVAPTSILDLGCGNGALLMSLRHAATHMVPFGIDSEETRIQHAKLIHAEHANNFLKEDMFARETIGPQSHYDYVLLMPGRLVEVDEVKRRYFQSKMEESGAKIFAYAYDEWVQKSGSFANLCMQAGLNVVGVLAANVAIVDFA